MLKTHVAEHGGHTLLMIGIRMTMQQRDGSVRDAFVEEALRCLAHGGFVEWFEFNAARIKPSIDLAHRLMKARTRYVLQCKEVRSALIADHW